MCVNLSYCDGNCSECKSENKWLSKSYSATVIVEPKGRGGAYLIIDGRTFVLRGGIVRGLRELETQ